MMEEYLKIFKDKGVWSESPTELQNIVDGLRQNEFLDLIKAAQAFYQRNYRTIIEAASSDSKHYSIVPHGISLLQANWFLPRALLIFEVVWLDDPIPSLVLPVEHYAAQFYRGENYELQLRRTFSRCLSEIQALESVLLNGTIKLIPESFFKEVQAARRARELHIDQFMSGGPSPLLKSTDPRLLNLAFAEALVFPQITEPQLGTFRTCYDSHDAPHNLIEILFRGDLDDHPQRHFYQLFEIDRSSIKTVPKETEKSGAEVDPIEVKMLVESRAIGTTDKTSYYNWRDDSICKAALSRLTEIEYFLALAQSLGGGYYTSSKFNWRIIREVELRMDRESDSCSMRTLEAISLPYLVNSTLKDVLSIRNNESTFHGFRQLLGDVCKTVADANEISFSKEIRKIEKDILIPELARLDEDMRTICRKSALVSIIEFGSLYLGASTAGFPFAAAGLLAAGKVFSDIIGMGHDMRKNGVYMLWELKKKKERAERDAFIV